MIKIKIDFVDFWDNFNKTENLLFKTLAKVYDVEISNKPDFLFFSVFGNKYKKFNCTKIFYTGENLGPENRDADYYLGFDKNTQMDNYYRFPLYAWVYIERGLDFEKSHFLSSEYFNREFCAFVHGNKNAKIRNRVFRQLSKYKKVSSGGLVFNNIGNLIVPKEKVNWIRNFKFSFAFENDAYRGKFPGYITEKIIDSFQANTIPLYWGCPEIDEEFNKKSFINFSDFADVKSFIDYIEYIDNNEEAYLKILNSSPFNTTPDCCKIENLQLFYKVIFG